MLWHRVNQIGDLKAFTERCEGEYGIENVERFAMMRIEDYTTIASRAAVYTAAILHCKMLVGKSQTLSELHRSGAGYAMESLNSTKICWRPDVKKKRQSR